MRRREVEKAVRARKACSVIMAPNIDQDEEESRLDGLLDKLLRQAGEFGIPVIHALTRKKLGQARLKPKTLGLPLGICAGLRVLLCWQAEPG